MMASDLIFVAAGLLIITGISLLVATWWKR